MIHFFAGTGSNLNEEQQKKGMKYLVKEVKFSVLFGDLIFLQVSI